jgi:hypothetical protein
MGMRLCFRDGGLERLEVRKGLTSGEHASVVGALTGLVSYLDHGANLHVNVCVVSNCPD